MPRDRLYERALRGRWPLFPVSPEPFYERLANGLGDGYRSKGQTFRLERRIEAARTRLDRNTAKNPAKRHAARRAVLAFCYQADQALENVAYLHIAAGRLTSFAPAAAKLGSARWMPIVALAQAAIVRERHDIAREVFAAADRPGLRRDHPRERCIELTGTPPTATSA